MLNILQWKRKGPFSATLGTAVMALLQPNPLRGRVIITRLAITNGATAQTLTVLQVLAKRNAAAEAASGQKVVVLNDVTGIAANDLLGIMINGRYELYTVASVDAGTKAVTMVENLSAVVAEKAPVCFFGVPADGHEQVAIPTSATTVYESDEGYFGANEMGDPILLHLTNGTNAAKIDAVNCPIISV